EALTRGRYKEAAASYQAALTSADVQARAELGLRQVQFETGQYEAAAGAGRFGAAATSLVEPTALLRARASLARGDVAAAHNHLTAIDTPAARLMRAELLLQSGKRQEALPLLMTVIE